ncbi:MAG: CheR family methyltransferase [Blastocatellia bacterium]
MSDTNLPASKPTPNDFLVVGLGASAGGIQALKEFFERVPADSGMAYVVILHLSPDHDSQLAAVLQTVTKIPVTQVTETVRISPNHVYVVSPNQHLEMHDGTITVTPNTLIEERRAPVDIFFRTLAESHGAHAVAVVLSGTGANGSMGLKRIKERGGAAFVQNPREAEFSEMPRNSIATDLVDDILPVAEIPAKIIAYKESLGTIEIPVEAEARPEDQQQALREVFTQLRLRTGHDFSNYKRPTLLRRIERRINIRNLPNLPSYAAFLHQHPEETQALLKDLLISVTNFFRDSRAFEAVERDILPRLVQDKRAGSFLRIWVVGCATGEEAYSIAMLCAEKLMGVIDAPKVQIFATDIDEAAITVAREGLYTINDAADVSPERLRRFFTKEGESYRVRRELREMVLFAVHNVIKDPPFSHLDLVTCRNMLIYLNHTAQERVMETLHFALNPGGFLFLGMSESVEGAGDLFVPASREHHIFQSRQVASRAYPVPESVPNFRIEKNRTVEALLDSEKRTRERITFGDLHQRLLEQYAPPSLVVNEEYDIVHLTERAGHYLQIGGGEPSNNLLKLVRQELRLELRTALYQATQRQTNVEARNLQFRINDYSETVNIHVRPVLQGEDTARGFLLVLFEPGAGPTNDEEKIFTSDEPMAR